MIEQVCKDETYSSTCDSQSCEQPNIYSSPSKKQKLSSDRYLPLRKVYSTPAKQLSINNFQLKLQPASSDKAKQLTLADYYEMGILGKKKNSFQDGQISSFFNNNSLKFTQVQDQNKPEYSATQDFLNISSLSPKKKDIKRKINKKPIKVLDAPELANDFYSNLLDWSSSNLISVGLEGAVYVYNPSSLKTEKLAQLGEYSFVSSISSCQNSNLIAVGTSTCKVQLWDCQKKAKIRIFQGHKDRVGTLSWNNENIFASGSRDKSILIRDIRQPASFVASLFGHKEQICGLKWSFDRHQLASGGNDNKVNIWNIQSANPSATLTKHKSAVRALAWSPHQHGLLVSGGGVADKTIRFWNSLTGEQVKCFPTQSQVCNIIFSKNTNELVSTHGYLLNEINVWKLPNLQKLETITGHRSRVLYLAMNPSGTNIVTGAGTGDECLNIWNIFPQSENYCGNLQSNLMAQSLCLR